jgi:transcriptional regulator with PAS, ATPase and Fis domain/putative methionine-R-sulfoxide reductase with GAF domain
MDKAMTKEDEGTVDSLWEVAFELLQESGSLPEVLARLAEAAVKQVGADFCAVYLLDRRSDELMLSAKGGDMAHMPIDRMRIGQGITGMAAFHARPLRVPRMQHDPRSVGGKGHAFKSIVAIPIASTQRLLGVFNLQSRAEGAFSVAEISLLEKVFRPLFVGLVDIVRTRESMERRTEELQALNELGQAMNSGLGLDESLELIVMRAAEVLKARGAAISLIVEDGSLARATMVTERPFNWAYEKRIAEYVAATGEPIMVDDLRTDIDPSFTGTSLACVPLVLEERVVGTLTFFDKINTDATERRLFNLDDLNMLFALSSQIAAEIEDIRLTGRLQELVRTEKQQAEELRVLYNRSRALLESISDGLLAISREGVIVEANSVARRILGEEALLGERIQDWVEDKPPLAAWLEEAGQFSNRVVTLRGRSGQVAAMANLQPVIDDREEASGAVLTFREMGEVGRLVNRVIGVQRTFSFEDILGRSPAIEKTKELARVAAGTRSNILIQGETGTGKEVFAQAIHNASAFNEGPFLAVNCAALPHDLIESELFGYVEGAFTGASKKGRLGKFELASGGTLFLDEIGEMPPEVQVKLLRVLQEKAIVRVGGDRTIPVDCRVITATNRDLRRAVEEGIFRRDLLYRLDVITIEVPPLRERKVDFSFFVDSFVRNFSARNNKVVIGLENGVLQRMQQYNWPGNVRELENAIEHAVALTRDRKINWSDLPQQLQNSSTVVEAFSEADTDAFSKAQKEHDRALRHLYLEALRAGRGEVDKAAELLGVSRATFYRHIRQHDLKREILKMRYEFYK